MLRVWHSNQQQKAIAVDLVCIDNSTIVADSSITFDARKYQNVGRSGFTIDVFGWSEQGCSRLCRTPNHRLPELKRVVLRPPRTTYFPGAFFMRGRKWQRSLAFLSPRREDSTCRVSCPSLPTRPLPGGRLRVQSGSRRRGRSAGGLVQRYRAQ